MWNEYHKQRIVYLRDLLEAQTDYFGPEFDWERLRNLEHRGRFEDFSSLFSDIFSAPVETLETNSYFLLTFWGIFLWDESIPFETRLDAAREIVTLGELIRDDNERKFSAATNKEGLMEHRERQLEHFLRGDEFDSLCMARWYLLAGLDAVTFFLQHVMHPVYSTDLSGRDGKPVDMVMAAVRLGKYCPRFLLKSLDIRASSFLGLFESTIVSYSLGLNDAVCQEYLECFFEVLPIDEHLGTNSSILSLACLLEHKDAKVRRRGALAGASLIRWSSYADSSVDLLETMSPSKGLLPFIVSKIAENVGFSAVGDKLVSFLSKLYEEGAREEAYESIKAICAGLLKKGVVRQSSELKEFISFVLRARTDSRTRLAVAIVSQAAKYDKQTRVLSESLSKADYVAFRRYVEKGTVPRLLPQSSEGASLLTSLVMTNYMITAQLHETIFDQRSSLLPGFEIRNDETIQSLEYNLPPRDLYIQSLTKDDRDQISVLEEALKKNPCEFLLYLMLSDRYFERSEVSSCGDVLQRGVSKAEEIIKMTGVEDFRLDSSHHPNRPLLMVFKEYANYLSYSLKDLSGAIPILEFLLAVDPKDIEDAKTGLLNCFLRKRNFIQAEKLLEAYSHVHTLDFTMVRAFIAFIRKDMEKAQSKLTLARRANPYVIKRILEHIGPKDYILSERRPLEREAINHALEYRALWESTPRAISWLKAQQE